jgi:biopolymer transport protein ExbD
VQVRINKQPVAWERLEAQLTDIYKMRAQRVLFIRGEDDLDFAEVIRVIDAARRRTSTSTWGCSQPKVRAAVSKG